jgi:hypothetical protein
LASDSATGSAGTSSTAARSDHDHANGIYSLIANSKGSLITSTGSAVAALSVGSDGQTLVADSSVSNGIKWAAPAGGADIDPLFLAGV